MWFKKKETPPTVGLASPLTQLRWLVQEVYKEGEKPKLVKTEKTLQYSANSDAWFDVWSYYKTPIYLKD